MQIEYERLAAYCKASLAFDDLPERLFFAHLPLCVVEAVFSINSTAQATRKVVERCATALQVPLFAELLYPPQAEQVSISAFCQQFGAREPSDLAENLFANRQRTSVTNGILKAEAVLRFCAVLQQFGIEYLQDASNILQRAEVCTALREIPGQRSGVSLSYFAMLTGDQQQVKPDRMLVRFIVNALECEEPRVGRVSELMRGACELLRQDFPHLTPAQLDKLVWQYQRKKSA